MCEIEKIHDRIWRFDLPLPDNPLKILNCYVLKADRPEERSLLIDTGFNLDECRERLFAAMDQLGLNKYNTDIFLTHSHADHSGNAEYLRKKGYRVLMGRYDYESLQNRIKTSWRELRARTVAEGITNEFFDEVWRRNQGVVCASGPFDAVTVEDGDVLHYAGYELKCVMTPGHTPGHMCLYDGAQRILFSGDHILWGISPNVLVTSEEPDILRKYLGSLRRAAGLDAGLILPSHRSFGALDLKARAEELIAHHGRRLDEMLAAVAASPGEAAFDLARHITWGHGDMDWNDFSVSLKWFAFGETLAHLDYLSAEHKLYKRYDKERGAYVYFVERK